MDFLARPRDRQPRKAVPRNTTKRERELQQMSEFFGTGQSHHPKEARELPRMRDEDGGDDKLDKIWLRDRSGGGRSQVQSRATTYLSWSPCVCSPRGDNRPARLESQALACEKHRNRRSVHQKLGRDHSRKGIDPQQKRNDHKDQKARSPTNSTHRVSVVYEEKGAMRKTSYDENPIQDSETSPLAFPHRTETPKTRQPVMSTATQTIPFIVEDIERDSNLLVLNTTAVSARPSTNGIAQPADCMSHSAPPLDPSGRLPEAGLNPGHAEATRPELRVRSSSPGYLDTLERSPNRSTKPTGLPAILRNSDVRHQQQSEDFSGRPAGLPATIRETRRDASVRKPQSHELQGKGENDVNIYADGTFNGSGGHFGQRTLWAAPEMPDDAELYLPRRETMDSLISRVDRQLAHESALKVLSSQEGHIGRFGDQPISLLREQADPYDIGFAAARGQALHSDITNLEGPIELARFDAGLHMAEMHHNMPLEGGDSLADFWRPNIFM